MNTGQTYSHHVALVLQNVIRIEYLPARSITLCDSYILDSLSSSEH